MEGGFWVWQAVSAGGSHGTDRTREVGFAQPVGRSVCCYGDDGTGMDGRVCQYRVCLQFTAKLMEAFNCIVLY